MKKILEKNYREILVIANKESLREIREKVMIEARKYTNEHVFVHQEVEDGISYEIESSYLSRRIRFGHKKESIGKGKEPKILDCVIDNEQIKIQIIKEK